LAIGKKRVWAQAAEGRKRTLRMLERAETFFDDWKQSEGVRREEARLRAETPVQPKAAADQLEEKVKALWAASKFNEEVRKDITAIAQFNRAFIRAATKEATSPEAGLEEKFDSWRTGTDDTAKLAALEKWIGETRQNHYFDAVTTGTKELKDLLWSGQFATAWKKIRHGIQGIDATTGEYADEIGESILAIASLIDIFHRMAVAIGKVEGVRKKVSDDLEKKQKEKDNPPPSTKTPPKIFGRVGADSQDNKWAQDLLSEPPKWGKEGTALADGLSLIWSIDGGLGVGVGGAGAGAGLGAFAVAGLSVTAPSFKLPDELMKKLSSKLMLIRFFTKFIGVLCEVIDFQIDRGHRPVPQDVGSLIVEGIAWVVQAVHQTLKEVLCPGELGEAVAAGREADPLEDWLYAFLSGATITTGAQVEGLARAVGTVLAAEARGSMGAELSVSLASLLEPLVEALQHQAVRNPGDKLPLGKRIIPKFSLKVKQTISGGVSLGELQLDLGLTGQSLSADLLFPDGSPLRTKLEDWMAAKLDEAISSSDERESVRWAMRQEGGLMHGLARLCSAVEKLLKTEIIPNVMDWEKKTSEKPGEEGPGLKTALVTNPAIQRMFESIRDPVGTEAKREKKKQKLDQILEIIRKDELHFGRYSDSNSPGLRTTSAPSAAFNALLLLPDGEVGQLSPTSKVQLQNITCRIPVKPKPAHAAHNTYRQKSDPKAKPINGIVVGFAKQEQAVSFVQGRKADWVDASVASVPPWPSPRAGESRAEDEAGDAQWYHWLNTKLFQAVEDARGKGERIDQPRTSVDADGVLLTFTLVARGLLDKAPFNSFGMVKVEEELLTEATIMEGAWEDDVAKLRSEIAESIRRRSKPKDEGAGAAAGTPSATAGASAPAAPSAPGGSAPSSAPPSSPPASTPTAPSVPTVPTVPTAPPASPPIPPVVAGAAAGAGQPATLRYSVKRAQVSVNHRLRNGGVPGWTKPLSPDGHFGPKTRDALDAWSKSLGQPPVQAEMRATVVEVSSALAKALDDEHDSSVVAFAKPHDIPEDDAPWMAIARGELGQKEIKGGEDNPRIREYHSATTLGAQPDEVAWCSSFVNWCLKQAKITGTRSAAAASWANWGQDTDPRRGAIVVIYNAAAANSALSHTGNHVGFLVEDVGWGWKLLGGNQSDMVKESCFSKKKWALKAVKWPT
jgi:uncharacterized protein (TIGR02594 family)